MILVHDSFRYILFKNRQRKRILPTRVFLDEITFFVKFICKFNRNLKNAFLMGLSETIFLRAIG
jgi:hypothetical protein